MLKLSGGIKIIMIGVGTYDFSRKERNLSYHIGGAHFGKY